MIIYCKNTDFASLIFLYILNRQFVSHLFSHSVVIRVVNSVVYDDSIWFSRWMPHQGDRGGSHVC